MNQPISPAVAVSDTPTSPVHANNTTQTAVPDPNPVATAGLSCHNKPMSKQELEYQTELDKRNAGIKALSVKLAQAQLDERNWLAVADHVLAGDYEHCGASTKRTLWVGLSSYMNPKCIAAAQRLLKAL